MTAIEAVRPRLQSRVVALIGNPNTGKTTLFNALARMRQRVGNYSGVTVEIKKGRMTFDGKSFEIIDLPGTYSLAPRSPDEMVAVDLILGQQPGEPRPDVVVSIVDASNLERNLYLTTQVMELGIPLVLALNMTDVADGQGLQIDAARLENQLGIRVVPIQANKGKGLERLKKAIDEAVDCPPPMRAAPAFPEPFEREEAAFGARLGGRWPPFLIRRLLLDIGGYTEKRLATDQMNGLREELQSARLRLASAGCKVPEIEARTRYGWIRQMSAHCVRRPERRPITWTDRLDHVLTHKIWGTAFFLALMMLVFQTIFAWAVPLMDLLKFGKEWLGELLRGSLPAGPLASLAVDGVLEGVGSVLVFLPQIMLLFAFIAIMEDCGYMARAAFLMDKIMAGCGLSGKSFIPMLSSVACAVPGIMASRVIENRRDRLATILVAPLMSCSARLPVYTLMIGAFLTSGYPGWVPGLTLFAMYLIGLLVAPLIALLLKRTILRGETPVFVMEMPVYKRPSLRTVLRRVLDSGWAFVRRAGTFILASMVLIWALLYFPREDEQGQSYDLQIAKLRGDLSNLKQNTKFENDDAKNAIEDAAQAIEKTIAQIDGEWKRNSYLGRIGHTLEPVVKPLGWDWKIGMAALASFPAREVVVGTMGIIYNMGKVDSGNIRDLEQVGATPLAKALQEDKVFTVPVALSLMIFFALCCQCTSTLAVIRRETNSWRWPLFTFGYMTVLAYLGALLVYQVGNGLS
jgi:ferrous iron transport protein B